MDVSLVTSISTGIARAPALSSSRAVDSSCERVLAAIAIVVPIPPSASAIARPIPRPPPVTSAILPTYFSTFPLLNFFTCAKRSVFIFGVETRVLVEEGQRLHRLHAIEEEHAIEVIGLVLGHARGEILQRQLDAAPGPVERLERDVAVARHHAADVGDAETALPSLFGRRAARNDLGIDDDRRFALLVDVLLEHPDEDAQPLVHLRTGETNAVVLVHRVEHVVDEFLNDGALDVGLVERPRALTEDRMAHPRDFQDRHEARLYGVQRGDSLLRPVRRYARIAAREGDRARAPRLRPLQLRPLH